MLSRWTLFIIYIVIYLCTYMLKGILQQMKWILHLKSYMLTRWTLKVSPFVLYLLSFTYLCTWTYCFKSFPLNRFQCNVVWWLMMGQYPIEIQFHLPFSHFLYLSNLVYRSVLFLFYIGTKHVGFPIRTRSIFSRNRYWL